jgi:hypothetical protein
MTPEETNCFTLLDDYARTRHGCFLAEFFLSSIQTEYVLCFGQQAKARTRQTDMLVGIYTSIPIS